MTRTCFGSSRQPELELPTSGTPPAERHQHQQQPEWERCKGQWQQPDQVGGDKAKQAQRRDKQAELANRDPAGRHPRTRAIAVCSLRSRAYRNRPETPVSSNAGWSSSAGVDTVTSREEQTSSSLCETGSVSVRQG